MVHFAVAWECLVVVFVMKLWLCPLFPWELCRRCAPPFDTEDHCAEVWVPAGSLTTSFLAPFSCLDACKLVLVPSISMLIVQSHFFLNMEELWVFRFKSWVFFCYIFSYMFFFFLRASVECVLNLLCLFWVFITISGIICSFPVSFVRCL